MNRAQVIIPLFAVVLMLQGCAGGLQSQGNMADFNQAASAIYMLDSGDRVRISVFGQAELNGIYAVDGAGSIAMPLIGAVSARGLSARQLEQAIASKVAQKFIKNPNVTVEVETHRPFFILGEVTSSGQYSYVNGMTAQTAIAIGGGFSPRAVQDQVQITRMVGGKPIVMVVPISTIVRPGDTIKVLERFI